MGFVLKILLLSCCTVGISQANIFDSVPGIIQVVNPITKIVDVGIDTIFNYQTDYNVTGLLNQLVIATFHTLNHVFNNDSGVVVSEKVKFFCINSESRTLQETALNDPDITSKILKNKQLVLVTHGWIDNAFRTWVQNVLNAYIHMNTGTICAVDWSYLANYEYTIAATKWVYEVAKVISNWLTVTTGLIEITNDNVILVGHSLGGQISGMVGMHQSGSIPIIYALDPAGPLFCSPTLLPIDRRLDPTDAKYVQVIMTTAGTLGCLDVCGHETFYPNGGIAPQGGCYIPILENGLTPEPLTCSHLQACQLFWWSLFPENDLTSYQCFGYASYLAGLCKGSETDQLGWFHKKTTGIYYLKTGSKPPSGNPSAPSTPK